MEAVACKQAAPGSHTGDDQRLIEQAMEGNQQAFAVLMNRHECAIKRTILKMVSSTEDAEDLTLEAFSKAFHHLSSYSPHFSFSTWLHRIAVNHCIDHLRRKKRLWPSVDMSSENAVNEGFVSSLASPALNPEEMVIRRQRHEQMHTLIGKLSPRYREILELHYFEGLSYEEIAQALDTPMGTVKAQLHRAREAMRIMLVKSTA